MLAMLLLRLVYLLPISDTNVTAYALVAIVLCAKE